MRELSRKLVRRNASELKQSTPEYLFIMLRGGRMTKVAGVAASYAPTLGTVGSAFAAGAVALGTLFVTPMGASAQVVPGSPQCSISGTTATCTGDLSAGIDIDGPAFDTLNVNTVDPAGITPASGVEGIDFDSTSTDITINADTTGSAGITTTGAAAGIDARVATSGNVTVNSVGTISGGENGIYTRVANGNGNINITSNGDVTARTEDAVYAALIGDGDIAISQTGNVAGDEKGVYAYVTGSGDISINVTGNTTTQSDIGIYGGVSIYGAVTIQVAGDVTSGDDGIVAEADAFSAAGDGVVNIDVTGNITSSNAYGIAVDAYSDVTIAMRGNVMANRSGIFAESEYGAVNVLATGSITATNDTGIYAETTNNTISIDARGDINAGQRGIEARVDGTGSTVVMSSGNIIADDYGILAYNSGAASSSVDVTVSGSVTSMNDYGIDARNRGTGGITVQVTNSSGTASATGANAGIRTYNTGIGAVSITADNAYSTGDPAILVDNSRGGGNVSVTVTGNVSGAGTSGDGIEIENGGVGDVVVSAVSGSGTSLITAAFDGVDIDNDNGSAVSVTVDNITAGSEGIYIENAAGVGSVSVGVNGSVTAGSDGIEIENDATGGVTINATNAMGTATVSGGINGIYVENNNGGAVSITANNVSSTNTSGSLGDGIYVTNNAMGTTLSITTTGTVSGVDDGITANHYGSGDLTINATNSSGTASVSGAYAGIFAYNGGDAATNISVDTVSGTNGGILASGGTSSTSMSIVVNGSVTAGPSASGVSAVNNGTGGISVTANNSAGTTTISGGALGIGATNTNGGAVSITANNVYSTATTGTLSDAISVTNDTAGTSVLVGTSGTVRGAAAGIFVDNNGTGDLSIVSGNSTGTASVTGGVNGIFADNSNGGALNIIATNVSSTNTAGSIGDAIFATNGAMGTSLSINASGTVSGQRSGIYAVNVGTGDLNVTASNPMGTASVYGASSGLVARNLSGGAVSVIANQVTGQTGAGIIVQNDSSGTDLTVSASGPVRGETVGISAFSSGTGNTRVTANNSTRTGYVFSNGNGVSASTTNGALTVYADDVRSVGDGIIALTVQTTTTSHLLRTYGDIVSDNIGILSSHGGSGDLTINATNSAGTALVRGAGTGIAVVNGGYAALNVSVDDVVGTTAIGISAVGGSPSTSMSLNVNGSVTGGDIGLIGSHAGSGDLTINANNASGTTAIRGGVIGLQAVNSNGGAVSVTANNVYVTNTTGSVGDAITATNDAMGTSVSVNASGTILGGTNGIFAVNDGTGDLTINATNSTGTASVTGGVNGIYANNTNGGAVTITADNASSTNTSPSAIGAGIDATNGLMGTSVSITTTGTVSGSDNGISAVNNGSGDLTVNATNTAGTASVTGGDNGLRARNLNGGAVTISANSVTAQSGAGILAENDSSGTSLTVNATGPVQGFSDGIRVDNDGTGDLTINATNSTGTALVTGVDNGIYAENANGGAISITADTVVSTSATGLDGSSMPVAGIDARNRAGGTDIGITVNQSVSGGYRAVRAYNEGTGNTTITATNSTGTNTLTGLQFGIYAIGTVSSDAMTIIANDVTGTGTAAIFAGLYGRGALSVTSTNDAGTAQVTSNGFGAYISNGGDGATSLSFNNVSSVSGYAIYAVASGTTTDLSITTTGLVQSQNNTGIFGGNYGIGDLTITTTNAAGTGRVEGNVFGIIAQSDTTSGAMTITTNDVTETTSGDGIYTRHRGSGDLTITSGNATGTASVRGNVTGVRALNDGTGAVSVSVNNATSSTGDAIVVSNSASGTNLAVNVTGTVNGNFDGIDARNLGTGSTTINATNAAGTASVTSSNAYGIFTFAGPNTTDTSITVNNVTSGFFEGILARHSGSGDLTITSSNGAGTATVTGDRTGIFGDNNGAGALNITVDNVYGTSFNGILADNDAMATDISVTANGTVTGGRDGIYARNLGTGDITINATNAAGNASVTGVRNGIYAVHNNVMGGGITINANNVTATEPTSLFRSGIFARNSGTGGVSVTSTNAAGTALVRSYGGDGVRAVNIGGGMNSVTVDNARGLDYGIYALGGVTASGLSVTVNGTVRGDSEDGILARNEGTGDITINATNAAGNASVTGAQNGIYAANDNAMGGGITINANNVTATNSTSPTGDGINALNRGTGGVSVTSTNAAGTALVRSFGSDGVQVNNLGGGMTSITVDNARGSANGIAAYSGLSSAGLYIRANGTVTGDEFDGINASDYGVGDLTIVATNAMGTASVTGDTRGIDARNNNGGAVTITVDNAAGGGSTLSPVRDGIYAVNDTMGTSISITSNGTVTSETNGIRANNNGTGDVTVTAQNSAGTAQVTGGIFGIYTYNRNGGAVSVSANNVTAGGDAIRTRNDASGTTLSVNATGTVMSGDEGIDATNNGSGDLTINSTNAAGTALVDATDDGIQAENFNGGALSITANNVIAGDDGIYAENFAGGTSLSINVTGMVMSGDEGIEAVNYGTGDLTITASNTAGTVQVTGAEAGIYALNIGTAAVTVTADNTRGARDAIYAANSPLGTSISITSYGNAISDTYGIRGYNYGSGDFTVIAQNTAGTAQVTGGQAGIVVSNYNGGAVSVSANNVTGTVNDGIFAYNDASGTGITITSTGTVDGGGDGIQAVNESAGDLTINASNTSGTARVMGGFDGISADNYSGGALVVVADNVSGTVNDGLGILNGLLSTSVSVTTTGVVAGGDEGIDIVNNGSGGVTVTATNASGTASVSGADQGIDVDNFNGGAVTITAENVATSNTADASGAAINANNDAMGTSVSITTTGTVSSATSTGIFATNNGSGALTINATNATGTALVSGAGVGINALHNGSGSAIVSADNVSASIGDGIFAGTQLSGTGVSITANTSVYAGRIGIQATGRGSGDVTVTAANASGTTSVNAGFFGIVADSYNGGAISITADSINASQYTGIIARNDAMGTSVSITTNGSVTGGRDGIFARNLGTGPLTLTVAGQTSGRFSDGIDVDTAPGGLSVINLNAGADVSGGVYAIRNGAGDSTVFFNDGSTVSGRTSLGLGSDNLTIANADISAATSLDGGDDSAVADGFIDTLTFDGFNSSFSAALLNWENVSFSNSMVSFTGASITTPALSLTNGTSLSVTQPGFMLNSELSLDGTSAFNAGTPGAGNVMINGNVTGGGTLSTVDGSADDQLTVNGNITGAATLAVDANVATATADRISISGDATGPGGISVNGVGTTATPAEITVVDVGGMTSAGAFSLASANFTLSDGEAAQAIGAFTYRLRFNDMTNEFSITPFDDSGVLLINPVTGLFEAYPAVLTQMNTLGQTFANWSNRPSVGRAAVGDGAVARNLFDFDLTPENAIWFSLSGTRAEYNGRSTLNSDVDTDVSSFEMGMDFPVFEGDLGRLVAGASFAIQEASADIDTAIATGGIDTIGHSLTLSALWLGDNKFYANGQLRWSTFSSDMVLGGVGSVATGIKGEGVAASVEVGQAYSVSERLTLVPQFQLTHSDVSSNGIVEPFGSGLAGTISDGKTTTARVGLHAEHEAGWGNVFGSVSYIHAFDNDTRVNFAGAPFTTSLDDNRIELRAGGQLWVGENSILYGGLTAQGGLGDFNDDNAYSLTGGVRVRF